MIDFGSFRGAVYRKILRICAIADRTGVFIASGSKFVKHVRIGNGTRINGPIVVKGSNACSFGNYCAVGDGVLVITSNHDVTFPLSQYRLCRNIGVPTPEAASSPVVVGNNVWIGDRVIILPGVCIGDGAVIGAGSVVTKDVPANTIACGVPCRCMRNRLAESVFEELQATEWWLKAPSQIALMPEVRRLLKMM